jgi:two-component system, sensor histidine kinase and response regulator
MGRARIDSERRLWRSRSRSRVLKAALTSQTRVDRERKIFLFAAAGAAVTLVCFIAWIQFRIGGDRTTTAVDDIGEAVAAFVAVVCCGIVAKRTRGRPRLGWALLSASAFTWAVGEVVWSFYEVGLGIDVPYPSVADAGYLAAIPLAVAGVLAFFTIPRGTSTRLRLWLDGAIVFLALIFVAWTVGLKVVVTDVQDPVFEKIIDLAYPVGDILIGTILVLAIRRATDEAHGRLLLLLGGLAAASLADSAFAYLTATGNYGAIGSVMDVGWVAGYLMIGLAALWPSSAAHRVIEERPIDIWQLALPWIAILGAGLSAIVLAIAGHALDTFLSILLGIIAILVMVSQAYAHRESLSLLLRSRVDAATINDIIRYAPLGVVRIGADMRIIQANPRFAELLRRPEQEVVGAPLTYYLPPDEVANAAGQFRSLAGGSTSAADSELEAVRGDGTAMWLHWSATAVHKASGEFDYFIAMFSDTTARHQAEVAAVANINVLERLNRLKSEFLTMVRHEFRTALVGIQGFSELMRDTEQLDLPTVKAFASDIYSDTRRLDEMLDRMFDLDGLVADKVEIHLVPIDLGAAAGLAVALAEASGTKHPIRLDLDQDLPLVAGDAGKLAWLFRILLDNAIKYSPLGGEILVSVGTEPGQVVVSVKDHGVGMPPDFDDTLFARYQWSAHNPTTKVTGSGHGLPMARQIVEMHGGRIWFDSKAGAGSEFHFTVPMRSNRAVPHEKRVEDVAVAVPV